MGSLTPVQLNNITVTVEEVSITRKKTQELEKELKQDIEENVRKEVTSTNTPIIAGLGSVLVLTAFCLSYLLVNRTRRQEIAPVEEHIPAWKQIREEVGLDIRIDMICQY